MANLPCETALSVRQPWAWLLVNGYKDVENRNWSTNFRGDCLIHAGKSFDKDGYEWIKRNFNEIPLPQPDEFKRGGIVGWVRVMDCVKEYDSPWFFGRYGFVMEGRGKLSFVPMRGQLGFFKVPERVEIMVEVVPSELVAGSKQKADIFVWVEDNNGDPVPDVSLDGETMPGTLGKVSRLPDTDAQGVSQGTWTAGNLPGEGLLLVFAEGGLGEAAIALLGDGDGGDDDDDDDDDEDDDGDEGEEGEEGDNEDDGDDDDDGR
jgi:hypothetical protein